MAEFDFKKEVVERSRELPVLVDFWADWCGPCKVLGPVLDQLEAEYGGRFEVVKVDTERHPEIASAFRIRSIPNVKLFVDGKVVDEFSGALPKAMVQKFLDSHLPEKGSASLDQILDVADRAAYSQTADKLNAFVEEHPDNERAWVQWQRYKLLSGKDVDEEKLMEVKMDSPAYDTARYILLLNEFIKRGLSGDEKVDEALVGLKKAWQESHIEKALDHLLRAVSIDKKAYDELPRRVGIAIFNLLGDQNPLVSKYRKLFNMSLY